MPSLNVHRQSARLDENRRQPVLLGTKQLFGFDQVVVDMGCRAEEYSSEQVRDVTREVVIDCSRRQEDQLG